MDNKILCVGFTPALQRILTFSALQVGEVNRALTQKLAPAGKGVNVAKVLKTLGSEPQLIGFLAGASGQKLASLLEPLKIESHWVWCEGETRNAHTLIDETSSAVTELVEEAQHPDAAQWREAFTLIDQLLDESRAVALCGALAPGSEVSTYARVIRMAHAKGVDCVVDAKGDTLTEALKEGPFVAKMNADELAFTTGNSVSSEAEVLASLRKLAHSSESNILVTQGKDLAYLRNAEGCWRFVPPRIVALNPIGSGDSVTAGILHAHGQGKTVVEAVACGLACGSANAETSGPGELHLPRVHELSLQVSISKVD